MTNWKQIERDTAKKLEMNFREWAQEFEAVEAYEFSYHPSFTNPFGASLWKTHSGDLYGSMWMNSPNRPYPASLGMKEIRRLIELDLVEEFGDLDPIAWRILHETLDRTRFWSDKEWEDRSGYRDGSSWHFEGLKDGCYLSRYIRNPEHGEPAYQLGRFFFSLIPSDFAFVIYDEHTHNKYETFAYLRYPTIFVY